MQNLQFYIMFDRQWYSQGSIDWRCFHLDADKHLGFGES